MPAYAFRHTGRMGGTGAGHGPFNVSAAIFAAADLIKG